MSINQKQFFKNPPQNILYFLFILSLFNNFSLVIFLLSSLVFSILKSSYSLITLNLIAFRTILNPAIAVPIDTFQNLKWLILFLCSFNLLLSYKTLDDKNTINILLMPIISYSIYSIISSFIFSSLPIVAIFKISSYSLVFISVLIGVAATIKHFDWLNWIHKMLSLIPLLSVFFIPLDIGYLRNGRGLQGITNHPNMFGIMLVLFIAVNIVSVKANKTNWPNVGFIMNGLALILIWMSQSRTSFISAIMLILLYVIFMNINLLKKILLINLAILFAVLIVLINSDILSHFRDFFLKGADTLILSRTDQIDSLLSSILKNPWFGTGFAVPVLPIRSFVFSNEFIVEPGNLLLSVLAYGGVFGSILFISYIFTIIFLGRKNFKNYIFLPLSTILISFGEMVFFSSNNIGIFLYMLQAIYIFNASEKKFIRSI